jgi:predicted nucleotidyltransferase component of viral defense system
MHKEILSEKQLELLSVMSSFRREYYLVGGTAIALYLGHRRSIDFDMFKPSDINHKKNLDRLTVITSVVFGVTILIMTLTFPLGTV